jgi:hypothetical protein
MGNGRRVSSYNPENMSPLLDNSVESVTQYIEEACSSIQLITGLFNLSTGLRVEWQVDL